MEAVIIQSDYEIERGKPMPSKFHAITQSNLNFLIRAAYGKQYRVLTEISIVINGAEKVPDLAIYDKATFDTSEEEIRTIQIPLGVIEILSPSQSAHELLEKSKLYFQAGIKTYWLIFPELRAIFVFDKPDDYEAFVKEERLNDKLLGIELDLKEVFE